MATEQPKPEWLIHTSVQDALCTLKKIDDIIRLLNKRSMNGKIVDP